MPAKPMSSAKHTNHKFANCTSPLFDYPYVIDICQRLVYTCGCAVSKEQCGTANAGHGRQVPTAGTLEFTMQSAKRSP